MDEDETEVLSEMTVSTEPSLLSHPETELGEIKIDEQQEVLAEETRSQPVTSQGLRSPRAKTCNERAGGYCCIRPVGPSGPMGGGRPPTHPILFFIVFGLGILSLGFLQFF